VGKWINNEASSSLGSYPERWEVKNRPGAVARPQTKTAKLGEKKNGEKRKS
jgi:hypothetical protein